MSALFHVHLRSHGSMKPWLVNHGKQGFLYNFSVSFAYSHPFEGFLQGLFYTWIFHLPFFPLPRSTCSCFHPCKEILKDSGCSASNMSFSGADEPPWLIFYFMVRYIVSSLSSITSLPASNGQRYLQPKSCSPNLCTFRGAMV